MSADGTTLARGSDRWVEHKLALLAAWEDHPKASVANRPSPWKVRTWWLSWPFSSRARSLLQLRAFLRSEERAAREFQRILANRRSTEDLAARARTWVAGHDAKVREDLLASLGRVLPRRPEESPAAWRDRLVAVRLDWERRAPERRFTALRQRPRDAGFREGTAGFPSHAPRDDGSTGSPPGRSPPSAGPAGPSPLFGPT
jgi:hypothetical protein